MSKGALLFVLTLYSLEALPALFKFVNLDKHFPVVLSILSSNFSTWVSPACDIRGTQEILGGEEDGSGLFQCIRKKLKF